MNKKMVITFLVATLLFIVIIFTGDLKMTNKTTNIENSEHFTKNSYQNSKLKIETTQLKEDTQEIKKGFSSSSSSEIIEPIKNIIVKDNSNTYELELVDNYKNSFEKTSYQKYKGKIAGNSFEIELPEYLIEMGHKITLNVRNLKTGDFNQIKVNISGGKLEIDENQLTNQQVYNDTIPQKITSGILPGVK